MSGKHDCHVPFWGTLYGMVFKPGPSHLSIWTLGDEASASSPSTGRNAFCSPRNPRGHLSCGWLRQSLTACYAGVTTSFHSKTITAFFKLSLSLQFQRTCLLITMISVLKSNEFSLTTSNMISVININNTSIWGVPETEVPPNHPYLGFCLIKPSILWIPH